MSRAPVTIAILAWNSWNTTKACLESLRPTLGIRDQVVVVDNGSTDGTPAGLKMHPWVEVVTNAKNRGFAGGCNDAAARARHDIIIFLNNDTVLAHRWIDPLVDAFADPTVGAAGPRSNFVSGEQVVDEATYGSSSQLRRFARTWAERHRGMVDYTTRLVGFCLAVRRSVFEGIGAFDEGYGIGGFEDDDLCQRILMAGFRLVISHGSFVHHEGHKTFDANGLDWFAEQKSNEKRFLQTHLGGSHGITTSISACLIVKDEEDCLPACLEALVDVVDEIVVYDTGSEDRTIEVARSFGATVILGFWDDNFARARNAALAECHGEWILWIDADEVLRTCDGFHLRQMLAQTRPAIDAWSVAINNAVGAGASSNIKHHATRLFRRARCEWAGRLHEQVVLNRDSGMITQSRFEEGIWIDHSGYLPEVIASKKKTERNLRVSQAEVDNSDGWERGYSLTSLSRSLMMAGRFEEALERTTEALDLGGALNPITRRLAVRTALEATLELRRLDESLGWSDRFRSVGADTNTANSLEAMVRLARREWSEALALLDQVKAGRPDADGMDVSKGTLAARRAQALNGLGRLDAAAEELLRVLGEEGTIDTHLGSLVDLMLRSAMPLETLARAIPADKVVLFMAQVLQLDEGPADLVLEACFAADVHHTHVLATASKLGLRLPLDRALVWSARLRAVGLSGSCPLLAIAHSSEDCTIRARAAATAFAAFKDPRSTGLFEEALRSAAPGELELVTLEARRLAPGLLDLPEGFAAVGLAD